MLIRDKPFEPFADGIVQICTVTNIAEEGDRPKDGLHPMYTLPFDYKTVGCDRYWKAAQADVKISIAISVPFRPKISTQSIAIMGDDTQYYIRQAQRITDTRPQTLKLSLEKVVENYAFENPAV